MKAQGKQGGAWAGQAGAEFSNPFTSELADAFPKHLPAWQANRNPVPFSFPILIISRRARKAGPLAEREGDVFSQSRAGLLVKGFENSAPA